MSIRRRSPRLFSNFPVTIGEARQRLDMSSVNSTANSPRRLADWPRTGEVRDCADDPEVQELVAAARTGSREAFATIVRRFQGDIRAVLGRAVGRADVVDDLAQEVFLTVLKDLDRFEGRSRFLVWMLGIARNTALMWLRGERRRRAREGAGLEAALAGVRVARLEARDGAREMADLAALEACLDELESEPRGLVEAVYFHGRTATAVARERGRSGSAVRMSLMRIRRSLADCIRKRGPVTDRDPQPKQDPSAREGRAP